MVYQMGWYTGSVIDDLDSQYVSVPKPSDGELAFCPRLQNHPRVISIVHRLHSIAQNIENGLEHQVAVDEQHGNARVVISGDLKRIVHLKLNEAPHFFQDLVDVSWRHC